MKHKFKKLPFFLVICMLGMFIACQEDFVEMNHQKNVRNKSGGGAYNLTGQETADAIAMYNNQMSKTRLPINFTLNGNDFMLLEDRFGKRQYTFMISHPDDSVNVFHNVVITDWDGLKKTMLVRYEMTEDFVARFNAGGVDFINFDGNITYSLLTADAGYPCGETPGSPIPVTGGDGPGDSGSTGGGSTGGGSGTTGEPWDPNGNGNPYNQGEVELRFLMMEMEYLSAQFNAPRYAHQSPRCFPCIERITVGPYSYVPPIDDSTNPCGEGDDIGILLPLQILLDPTFENNDCLMDVYNDLGGSPTFQNYLNNFDGDFSVANLKFSVGVDPNYPNANAVTYAPVNYLIEIKFNPNKLNRPSLDIARTFIHELIHAEIYRKLLSVASDPNGNVSFTTQSVENMRNNFPGLYDYYMRYHFNVPAGQEISDPQHEMMAQHYRNIIEDVLQELDPTQDAETYEALAWAGLMGDGDPDDNTGLPPQPTVAWSNLPQATRLEILDKYFDFKNSNPPCQN